MYDLYIKPYADKIFEKMSRKEKQVLEIIDKKIEEIRTNPEYDYKYLHPPLQSFNRVHINNSFVLIFKIIHLEKKVEIWAYEHHDVVYKGKWLYKE